MKWLLVAPALAAIGGQPGFAESPGVMVDRGLEGDWRGAYSCGQGVTGVTLKVSAKSGPAGTYPATFSFYPVHKGDHVASGEFRGILQEDLSAGE